MDRQELMYHLEEPTSLEGYFQMFSRELGKDLAVSLKDEPIICPRTFALEAPAFSHNYLWNGDRGGFACLADMNYVRHWTENGSFAIANKDITLQKAPRYMLIDNVELNTLSITYVLKGKCSFTANGHTFQLEEGNSVFFATRTLCSVYPFSERDVAINISLHAGAVGRLRNLLASNRTISKFIANSLLTEFASKVLVVKAPSDKRLAGLVLDMMIEQEAQRPLSDCMIVSLFELFIYALVSDYDGLTVFVDKQTKTSGLISSIISYMNDHLSDITLESLADRFCLSPSYISKILKQSTNKNYIQTLTDIRLDRAKELLQIESINVDDVARRVGYSDPRQLRRVFKKEFGVTPGEFCGDRF